MGIPRHLQGVSKSYLRQQEEQGVDLEELHLGDGGFPLESGDRKMSPVTQRLLDSVGGGGGAGGRNLGKMEGGIPRNP